ncbi:hypothetical protein TKK_0001950 [Trichogramma kaykai]
MLKFCSPAVQRRRRNCANAAASSVSITVNPGSKAAQQGVREGDLISSINGKATRDLTNVEAHSLLRNAGDQLTLGLNQENSSPKRRIYKSSLQENTSIETIKKITTKTTTQIITETKKNGKELFPRNFQSSPRLFVLPMELQILLLPKTNETSHTGAKA